MKHNRLILLSFIGLSFLLLAALGTRFTQSLYANGPTGGTITVIKEARPAEGIDFAFTTNALPITPTVALAWGSEGNSNGQFDFPRGVAVDSIGNVYVGDTYNHRIQKFDGNGTFLLAWGSQGNGNGQFYIPSGVAVDTTDNIYVVDSANNRIQKFDNNGNFLSAWGSGGNGDGQFNEPSGIVVDTVGDVYVADTLNYRIQKFDGSGNFLLTWGIWGSENGQFDLPTGIAVDAAGNVYVGDTVNHRVQKFDSSGNFLLTWGNNGSGNGQFNYPHGVAVDAAGNINVVDSDNNRIQKFDSDGNFLLAWGSFGSGSGQFDYPTDVTIDSAGNIYITDSGNNRIQKITTNNYPPNFALDDAVPDDGDAITNTRIFTGLLPASYAFTETVSGGWSLDSITCDGGSWTLTNESVTVNMADGEHIICTFSNRGSFNLFMPVVIRQSGAPATDPGTDTLQNIKNLNGSNGRKVAAIILKGNPSW